MINNFVLWFCLTGEGELYPILKWPWDIVFPSFPLIIAKTITGARAIVQKWVWGLVQPTLYLLFFFIYLFFFLLLLSQTYFFMFNHSNNMTKRVTLVYLYHVNRCGHHKKIVDCKVGLCTSLRTVAEFLLQYSA